MEKGKEWKRGYREGKKYFKKFRSFGKKGTEYYGYKKVGGSKEIIGPLSHFRATKGFAGGWYIALKEEIKSRPVGKIKRKTVTKPIKKRKKKALTTLQYFERKFGF